MFRRNFCVFALIVLLNPAYAAPGEQRDVTDIHGDKCKIIDNDNDLPTMTLVAKGYNAALLRQIDTNGIMLGLVREAEYKTFSRDKDMKKIIAVASATKAKNIVFLIPAHIKAHKISAVLFQSDDTAFYLELESQGKRSTTKALAKTLSPLPKVYAINFPEYLKFEQGNLTADDGAPVKAFKILSAGKLEIPRPLEENSKAPPEGQ